MEAFERNANKTNGDFLAEPYAGRYGAHGNGRFGDEGSGSDAASIMSSEEDHWGVEIGGYNENNAAFPPPPMPFLPPPGSSGGADGYTTGHGERPMSTFDSSQMEAMLADGFDARRYGSTFALGLASPDTPDSSAQLNPFNDQYAYPQPPRRPIMTNGYSSRDLPRHGDPNSSSVFGYDNRPKPKSSPIPFDDPRDVDYPGRNGASVSSAVESRSGHAKKRSGGLGVGDRTANSSRRMGPL